MGLFDLDEYQQKKQRADESATPPRAFPVAFAEVLFDGRHQKLRFEPVLVDGGHVFISFRPESADKGRTLIVGKEWKSWRDKSFVGESQQGFVVSTENAFVPKTWLRAATRNVKKGYFGRLTVAERRENDFVYSFYSAAGTIDEEDYAFYTDTTMWRYSAEKKATYDPSPGCDYWCNVGEASEILMRLDADEFASYIERQKEEPKSAYDLSLRWAQLSFKRKYAMLPPVERDVEREVTALMRSVVWSDPSLSYGGVIADQRRFMGNLLYSHVPLWRQTRFFAEPTANIGETFGFAKRFERRIAAIWPHVAAHFIPTFRKLDRSTVHPCLLHWMNYRGAYIVEFTEPNAHEHLEARLLLRDFLAEKGASLDEIDAELERQQESANEPI